MPKSFAQQLVDKLKSLPHFEFEGMNSTWVDWEEIEKLIAEFDAEAIDRGQETDEPADKPLVAWPKLGAFAGSVEEAREWFLDHHESGVWCQRHGAQVAFLAQTFADAEGYFNLKIAERKPAEQFVMVTFGKIVRTILPADDPFAACGLKPGF